MGRRLKYPELENILVGQSLFIPAKGVTSVQSVRNSVHQFAERRGLKFSVHDNGDEIEIARTPSSDAEAFAVEIRNSIRRGSMSHEELKAEVDRIAAELDAA